MQPSRILLVEDHALVRAGIRELLNKIEHVTVVGESSTGREALDALQSQPVDIVLMDIAMPDMSGLEALIRAYMRRVDVPVDVPPQRDPLLTPRQTEILRLIAAGRTTQEIAQALTISAKTVETHRAQLMQRLGIYDIAGLVRYAVRTGIIS
jgi:DNA-binding NarL/FixJ family response regulator